VAANFHFFVDGGACTSSAPREDRRESENIVDLVGIIRAPSGHDDVVPVADGAGLFVGDLRIGIGHGEDNRTRAREKLIISAVNAPFVERAEQHVGAIGRIGKSPQGSDPGRNRSFVGVIPCSAGLCKMISFGVTK